MYVYVLFFLNDELLLKPTGLSIPKKKNASGFCWLRRLCRYGADRLLMDYFYFVLLVPPPLVSAIISQVAAYTLSQLVHVIRAAICPTAAASVISAPAAAAA